jgi:hypothetical protein
MTLRNAGTVAGKQASSKKDRERAAKKEYLSHYRLIDAEIERLREERDEWFSRAAGTTPVYGPRGRKGGSRGDRLGAYVSKLETVDIMLNRRLEELAALRLSIERSLSSIGDPRLRSLLEMRYISGLTFEQISERLFYTWRQTMNLHMKALDCFEIGGE